ncbi:hypothetical protein D3C84_854200 [compost metagenome]
MLNLCRYSGRNGWKRIAGNAARRSNTRIVMLFSRNIAAEPEPVGLMNRLTECDIAFNAIFGADGQERLCDFRLEGRVNRAYEPGELIFRIPAAAHNRVSV